MERQTDKSRKGTEGRHIVLKTSTLTKKSKREKQLDLSVKIYPLNHLREIAACNIAELSRRLTRCDAPTRQIFLIAFTDHATTAEELLI